MLLSDKRKLRDEESFELAQKRRAKISENVLSCIVCMQDTLRDLVPVLRNLSDNPSSKVDLIEEHDRLLRLLKDEGRIESILDFKFSSYADSKDSYSTEINQDEESNMELLFKIVPLTASILRVYIDKVCLKHIFSSY